ncbi:MAG TPA: cysteine-rich CWC family protein [Longimicrobium sp.]|nr:cysteine-rich CWC family protein [Longimicrobium sp.]
MTPEPAAETPVDPARCPLCGEANGCAMAGASPSGGACWCASVTIAGDVLQRIPEEARRKACVCARCAEGAPRAEGPTVST